MGTWRFPFLLAGVLLGGSIWLDRNGTPAVARVNSKHEEIALHDSPQGEWSRWFRVGLEFRREDGGLGTASVHLPREWFDSLRIGDRVRIRYLPALPRFARPVDRSTVQVLRDAGSEFLSNPSFTRLLVWLVVGMATLWLIARIGAAAVFTAGFLWIAVAFLLLFPAPASIRLGLAETTAKVDVVNCGYESA